MVIWRLRGWCLVLGCACVAVTATQALFNQAQGTKNQARGAAALPFQVVEHLGAEGLPGVVGIAGIEDAGLEDAGGTCVAKK